MSRAVWPGIGASVLLADLVYDVPANVILDSARRALSGYDVITSCIKAWVFGLIISTVSDNTIHATDHDG